MISINRLYREILSKFNFSIVGYSSIDDEVNNFFDSMVKSSVFYERRNLDFISYAYAILRSINPFELESSEKTEFFFNTFKERSFELFLLHEYYSFKEFILIECKELANKDTSSLKAAELSSQLFCNPTPFRVIVTEEDYTTVKYDQHLDVLTFEIPAIGIFKYTTKFKDQKKNIDHHKSTFFKKIEEIITNGDHQLRVFKENNKFIAQKKDTAIFYNQKYISDEISHLVKTVVAKFDLLNTTKNHYFFDGVKKETLNEWVMFVISHAFLSYFMNAWVENIPSIIKDEGKYFDKKCLGVLIIGYEIDKELSDDERAMFRIIADRVSAAISTQNLLDNEFKLKLFNYREKRPEIFKKLSGKGFVTDSKMNNDIDKLLHEENNTMFDESNQAHKSIKEFVLTNSIFFGKIIPQEGKHFNKYKLFFLDGAKKEELKNSKVYKLAEQMGENSEPVNVLIIEELLTEINLDPDKITYQDSVFSISYESDTEFSPSNFKNSFTGTRVKGTGKLCQFIKDNYKDILINFNIQIKIGVSDFLNLERHTEYHIDGPKFTSEFNSSDLPKSNKKFVIVIEIK